MNLSRVIVQARRLLFIATLILLAAQSARADKQDQNITFVVINDKTYGDAPFNLQALASSGLPINFSVLSGPLTINGTTATITGIGPMAVVATQPGDSTWNPAAATNYFNVAPAVLSVAADDKFKTYGATNPPLTYNLSGFVNGENVSFISGTPAITTSATTTSPAGLYSIVAAAGTLQASNYVFNFSNGKLSVAKAGLTVTADAKSKTFGTSEPTLTYQITSGDLVGSDTLTGSLLRSAGENIGTYPITQGTLAASTNYTLTYIGTNLTIMPANLIIAADAQTKVYGDSDPALTYEIISGALIGSDSLTGTLVRAPGENVGNYLINQGTLAASTNYAIAFVTANLAITRANLTVAANDIFRRYGATNPPFTYFISGFVNGENAGVISGAPSASTVAGSLSPIGNYTITPSLGTLGATNYAFSFEDGRLSVMPALLTVAADIQSKLYGEAEPALTYQITSGVLFGTDALTGAVVRNPGENVGSYAITRGTLSAGTNYTLTFIGTNLTINPVVLTIAAENKSRAYGVTNPPLTFSTSGFVNGDDESVLSGTPSLDTDADSQSGIGDYLIFIGPGTLSATNYTFAFYDGALSVLPVELTITADAKGKTYGTTDPTLTYQISSGALANGDVLTGSLARVPGENIGRYAISQGTLQASTNYDLTYVGASLVISPAELTVAAEAKSKIYGTPDPSLTYHLTSGALVGSDSFSGSLTRTAGENIGAYPIGSGSLTAGTNYTLTFIGTNLTINPAALTIAADAKTKIYGAVDPALTYQITSGALVGQDLISGSLVRDGGENVGSYLINQATLTAGTNYSLTYVATNLTITPASLNESVTSSRNPTRTGSNVTFTAAFTAVAPGAGTPTGAVQFIVNGVAYGSPAVLNNGAATLSTSSLAHGYHTIAAAYAGNTNFFGQTNALSANQLINWAPVAANDAANTRQNMPITATTAALLANDTDGDLDPLSVTSVSATSFQGGTVSLNGGAWTYTPPFNFTGTDAFAYSASDTFGETATGFVIVTVYSNTNQPERVISLESQPDGSKKLTFGGIPGFNYVVQASTNLTAWVPVSTNTCETNGLFLFLDSAATNYPVRFYRSVSQ